MESDTDIARRVSLLTAKDFVTLKFRLMFPKLRRSGKMVMSDISFCVNPYRV